MTGNRRVAFAAFAVAGFIYGWCTSYIPMPADGGTAQFWLGNLCAPWLALAFFAGRAQTSRITAVLTGVATDVACVLGFYFRDLDLHARWSDDPKAAQPLAAAEIQHWLQVNDQWLAAALLAGALYGGLGLTWRRSRSLPAGLAVAAGFLVEPVLWPVYNGFYKGPWFLWAAEVGFGIGVGWRFAVVSRRIRRSPAGSPPGSSEMMEPEPR